MKTAFNPSTSTVVTSPSTEAFIKGIVARRQYSMQRLHSHTSSFWYPCLQITGLCEVRAISSCLGHAVL